MAATGKFVLGREKSCDLGQESQYWLRDRLQSPAEALGMALGRGCLGRGHRAVCSPCVLAQLLSPEPAQFTLCDRHTAQCWCPAGGIPGDRLPLSTQRLPRSGCLWSAHPSQRAPAISPKRPPAPTTASYRPRQPSWLHWRLPALRAECGWEKTRQSLLQSSAVTWKDWPRDTGGS